MVFTPVPNTAQVVVVQSLFGNEVNNVLHFARSGGYDSAALTALATLVRDQWIDAILDWQSGDLALASVRARDLTVADSVQVEVAPAEPTVGGRTANSMPGNVAFVVTHRTGLIGRSRRGRSYIGGLSEGDVTGNTLADLVAAGLVAGFNQLRNSTEANGYFFCIVSRFSGGDRREVGITTAVTGSFAVDARVDSQRGRLS